MSWKYGRRCIGAALAGTLLLGLSACRENEHNRPLTFEKGVYGGKPDQKLSDAQVDDLRGRAMEQKL